MNTTTPKTVPVASNPTNDDRAPEVIKALGNKEAWLEPGDYMRMGDHYVSWEHLMST